MELFAVGSVAVTVVAFVKVRRGRKNMLQANDWIANRVGQTIQGVQASAGGGHALSMGAAGAGNSMHSLQWVAALAALNTMGNNPLFEAAAGWTPNWMHPLARKNKRLADFNEAVWVDKRFSGLKGAQAQGLMNRMMYARAAEEGAKAYGGINTFLGASAAANTVMSLGGTLNDIPGALAAAGFTDRNIIYHVSRSYGKVDQNSVDYILSDKRLGRTVAAMQRLQSSAVRFADPNETHQSAREVAGDMVALRGMVKLYRGALHGGVTLDAGVAGGPERIFADNYMKSPDAEMIDELMALAKGNPNAVSTGPHTNGITGRGAQRLKTWIGNEHAKRVSDATDLLMADPTNYDLMRKVREELSNAQRTDSFTSGVALTQANTLQPPDPHNPGAPANWSRMSQVVPLMRRKV